MTFRIAFLNLEQDFKRWDQRRSLIVDELSALKPDIFAMNEISIPSQTGRWLQAEIERVCDAPYALVQQSKTNTGSLAEGEGLLTRFPIRETVNLDYRTLDYVAVCARMEVEGRLLDVYATHLYMSRGDESLRVFQVRQLLDWINSRDDADAQVVCGDFNAAPGKAASDLMAEAFRYTQSAPTAFTPLSDGEGNVSHPYWDRLDRCVDYIWMRGSIDCVESAVAFNRAHPDDETLWPSDHAGLWADLRWT